MPSLDIGGQHTALHLDIYDEWLRFLRRVQSMFVPVAPVRALSHISPDGEFLYESKRLADDTSASEPSISSATRSIKQRALLPQVSPVGSSPVTTVAPTTALARTRALISAMKAAVNTLPQFHLVPVFSASVEIRTDTTPNATAKP